MISLVVTACGSSETAVTFDSDPAVSSGGADARPAAPVESTQTSQVLDATTAASSSTADRPEPTPGEVPYPASVQGRKILDQYGEPFLLFSMSSWAMAEHLSDSEITAALEGVAQRGFNGVTVFIGGGYDGGGGWHRYTNQAGQPFWTGTPWASPLGPAWASVDRVVAEAKRLGLIVSMSLCFAYGSTGARADIEAVTDEDMYDVGVAVASRYIDDDNIVWHVMYDFGDRPADTSGQRTDAYFRGIADTEGADRRPVRWAEPNNGNPGSVYAQLIGVSPGFSHADISLNGWYTYTGESTSVAEAGYAEADMPVGDVEPPYDGAPHYSGIPSQQLRERNLATFLEGGVYINYGHEDWWPFGATGLYSEGLTWEQVMTHVHTLEAGYAWTLLDTYVRDLSWVPDDGTFLTDGTGSGETKAAAGSSRSAAIAYFPDARPITVDTMALTGIEGQVRLRWWDPTTGEFTTISPAEEKQAGRVIDQYPGAHRDGAADWVLVVDAAE